MKIKLERIERKQELTPNFWSRFTSSIPRYYPTQWEHFLSRIPGIITFVKGLPSKCPFEQAWNLVFSWRKKEFRYLIYFVPALCQLNPLFYWLLDWRNRLNGIESTHTNIDQEIVDVFDLFDNSD